jgi:hypothetical protein
VSAVAAVDPARALHVLAAELRSEGSVISPHVVPEEALEPAATLGELAGSGPHTDARSGLYAGVIESVREGYLLHYGTPRLIRPPDPDLALLAGDYLYAKGLGLLATEGDLASVNLLAELISASAETHAQGAAGPRADAVASLWLASAVAIAVGPGAEDLAAAGAVRSGGEAQALYAHAARAATQAGLGQQLARAAETVGFRPSNRG